MILSTMASTFVPGGVPVRSTLEAQHPTISKGIAQGPSANWEAKSDLRKESCARIGLMKKQFPNQSVHPE